MGKVIFAINVSIDGCYEHTFASPDAELMAYFTQLMHETDVIVYGRKTYGLMVPYWPDVAKNRTESASEIAFADAMTPIKKIVLSRTLTHVPENTSIVNDDPEGLIRDLRQQPGINIAFSSASLFSQMLQSGLIDELRLVIHPVLVGANKRLFNHFLVSDKRNFQLEQTQRFQSGVMALHYLKKE